MAFYGYKLGAGHNLPDGSLTNIEDITPAGDEAFYPPRQYGNYLPGVKRRNLNAGAYISGKPSDAWDYDRITWAQVQYLRDTYCAGGYSGNVTYTTQIGESGTYTRHNAVMDLPIDAVPDFGIFPQYRISFLNVSGTLT